MANGMRPARADWLVAVQRAGKRQFAASRRLLVLGLAALATCAALWESTRSLAQEPEKKADQPPEATPELEGFRRALQELLPLPGRPMPVAPPDLQAPENANQKEVDASGTKRQLDAYDRLAPIDFEAHAEWNRAVRGTRNGDWSQILNTIKRLNEARSEDTLTILDDGSVTSIRREASRLLAKAPAAVREALERTHRVDAEQALKRALAENDLNRLAQLAMHYFWMEPGHQAADALASRLLERGDLGMSLSWFKQLWEARASLTEREQWQRKALAVARMTGDRGFEKKLVAVLGAEANSAPLDRIKRRTEADAVAAGEWPLFLGTARRNAISSGSDPVSIERWQFPTTSSAPLQSQIDALLEICADQSVPTVPTAMPLLINGRIVFRSFHGLEVLDAKSGRLLWSLNDEVSADAMLGRGRSLVTLLNGGGANQRLMFGGMNAVSGPLGQYLFSNSARSLLSSDGRQLFVVDDDPIYGLNQTSWNMGRRGDEDTRSRFGTNTLRAYDLETGRVIWQVGGPELNEDFTSPLAGYFLLGAPVPDGNDLFVVGQKESEIRLHALEPTTGHVKWSQLIGFSDMPIERDLQRRIWSLQVSVHGSLVVCPTTVGWVVAVDRTQHCVMWAQRLFDRRTADESNEQPPRFAAFGGVLPVRNASSQLGSRWAVSAPMIFRDRVIVTPIEHGNATSETFGEVTDDGDDASQAGTIQCLDLFTGRRLWRRPRESMQYVAGVWNEHLILVGARQIKALTMDGKEVWSTDLPTSGGSLSGRGVIANGSLYQPLQRRALLKVDLNKGQIAAKWDLSDRSRTLGNLLMYRDLVISHHPGEVVALEQLAAIEQRLAKSNSNSNSQSKADDALLAAELALSQDQPDEALRHLNSLTINALAVEQRQRFQTLHWKTLRLGIARHADRTDEFMAVLRSIARTSEERQELDRLEIDRLVRRDRPAEAVRRLLASLDHIGPHLAARPDNVSVHVTHAQWVRGLLSDLWLKLSDKERPALEAELQPLLSKWRAAPNVERDARLAEVLSELPVARNFLDEQVRHAQARNEFVAAFNGLKSLERSAATPAEQAAIAVRQVQWLLQHRDAYRAQEIVQSMQRLPADTVLPDGKQLSEVRQALLAAIAKISMRPDSVAKSLSVEFSIAPQQYQNHPRYALENARRSDDFLSQFTVDVHQFNLATAADRLVLKYRSNHEIFWSVPLRAIPGRSSGPQVKRGGTTLMVLNGGLLQALSVPDRRVLWTATLEPVVTDLPSDDEEEDSGDEFAFNPQSGDQWEQHQLAPRDVFWSRLSVTDSTDEQLLAANSEFVVVRVKQQLRVLDLRTGEVRWSIPRLPSSSNVWATTESVFVSEGRESNVRRYRASDGRLEPDLPHRDEIVRAVFVNDSVVVSLLPSQLRDASILRARNFSTGQLLWEREFAAGTQYLKTADDELAAFTRQGQFQWVGLATGKLLQSAVLAPELRLGRNVRLAFSDRDRMYFVLSGGHDSSSYFGEIRILPLSGHLMVFDRREGQLLWETDVTNESLVFNEFSQSPVAILLKQESSVFDTGTQTRILLLDKQTGQKVFSQSIPSEHQTFSNIIQDLPEGCIDLLAFEQRYRLLLKSKP